jgi:ABC-type polysaccharide/polyol phosphate export permease
VLALFPSLARNKRLLTDFVKRDLKARYIGSSMGFFWSVVFPVLNLFVYMFVFRMILKIRFEDRASPATTAMVMLAGIIVWAAFAESMSRATNTLIENSNLIQKVVFPAEVLPVYLTLSSLTNMLIGVAVVLGGVAWFAYVSPDPGAADPLRFGPGLLALPLLVGLQAVLTVGLGSFLATINVFLRDTYHLVGVFVTVWMFATPIFYPARMVRWNADGTETGWGWVLDVNPMHWLIESYRSVLLYGRWPDWAALGRFALVAAALFALGTSFFMRQKKRFPDLL